MGNYNVPLAKSQALENVTIHGGWLGVAAVAASACAFKADATSYVRKTIVGSRIAAILMNGVADRTLLDCGIVRKNWLAHAHSSQRRHRICIV